MLKVQRLLIVCHLETAKFVLCEVSLQHLNHRVRTKQFREDLSYSPNQGQPIGAVDSSWCSSSGCYFLSWFSS
jgi:hypothetical protein